MTQGNIKTQHGVTLIELVVVIAIMGIIAGVAVPSFSSLITQARLKLVIETLRSDLLDAQRSVLAHGAAGTATIAFVDGSNWSYTSSGSKSLSRDHSQFAGALTLSSNFASDTFTITQKMQHHQQASPSGNVEISSSDASATISQSATGVISVCSDDSMGYPAC